MGELVKVRQQGFVMFAGLRLLANNSNDSGKVVFADFPGMEIRNVIFAIVFNC